MMKKCVMVLAVGFILAGCDKDAKDKPIADLTSEELTQLCSMPDVLSRISDNFKTGTIKDLTDSPLNYYPLINSKKDDPEYRYKDTPILYTAKVFQDGFGKSERLTVDNFTATGTQADSISCEATLNFDSDSLYKRKITSTIDYRLKKQESNFIPEVPNRSLSNMQSTMNEQPTQGQKEWRDRLFNSLAAMDDKVRSTPDDAFVPITQDDLYYIFFAQAQRDFSDDELMGFFSNKWNNTTDSFEKEDVKKEEIAKIKTKIAEYKNVKNVIVYSSSNYGVNDNPDIPDLKTSAGDPVFKADSAGLSIIANNSYDFSLKGFEYNGLSCDINTGSNYSSRGIGFSIDRRLSPCVLSIPEGKAREVSAIFSSLNSQHKSIEYYDRYFLSINQVDGGANRVSATLVREDIKIYNPLNHELIIQTTVK